MSIITYSDLSSAGKIIFSRYNSNTIKESDLIVLLSNSKITQEEYNFMLGK
jgi:hypothetical protein